MPSLSALASPVLATPVLAGASPFADRPTPIMFYVVPALMVLIIVGRVVQGILRLRAERRRQEHQIRMLELRHQASTGNVGPAPSGTADEGWSGLEAQYLRARQGRGAS
ncbi:hypothetical protein [Georgenia sp. Z1491]|uniref:hypothetical protein n=1 Tax=Georgenia sp. Z1491 TaxID=3416707 RepID=UPI003CE702DC